MIIFFIISLLACVGLCAWQSWQMVQLKETLRFKERSQRSMHQDLQGLIYCMRGISQRFDKQQKLIRSMSIRQNNLQSSNVNDSNYDQAALLLDKGASVDELIKTCGLSAGEVELMNRINAIPLDQATQQAGLR